MPIFIALFQLINRAAKGQQRGVLTATDVDHLSNAEIFGARISDTFTGATSVNVQILAGVLVVAMTLTTFLTQRQLMSKNMPADALSGPYANQQKMLLYILPVVFAVGGIAFPIGVLLYWTTSNLWTMSQQFYVIRNNPAPNTEAFRAKEARDAAKRKRKGGPAEEPAADPRRGWSTAPMSRSRNRRPSRSSGNSRRRSPAASGRTNPRVASGRP